ncbi:hypothetical protein [Ornithinimicrobium cryptoxanthini]|uniref:Uncharacterized protein n=1 Tax=Ornithinimicrobium cryptoxanthini TaxID=2934161 RepID=A0ABY4YG98_9MICO|nr:hypothetical protein [Ornithinimicrobium cryptoxanthini]USQ75570.1 hypothetical protein NF557_13250 [Ornithinimicrobium cryptoxanthini]
MVAAPSPDDQLAVLHDLRPRMSVLEFVFHHGDTGHSLAAALSGLGPERTVGVGPRPGYQRADPKAVLHRYAYDRSIIAALRDIGGLFTLVTSPRGDRVEWTELGDVDLAIYDRSGRLFLYTVTHEGLIFVR